MNIHKRKYNRVKIILVVAFTLWIIAGFATAYAMELGSADLEVTPYVKGGTIAWDQLGGVGGHKFLTAVGVNSDFNFDPLVTIIKIEGWWVSEELDDDKGIIPENGYTISADVKYLLKTSGNFIFYPYASIGYEKWNKGSSWTDWKTLRFFNLGLGGGADNGTGYIKAGITLPAAISAGEGSDPSARFGFSAEVGLRFQALLIGLFFDYKGFEDPDAKMTMSGLFLGYSFN